MPGWSLDSTFLAHATVPVTVFPVPTHHYTTHLCIRSDSAHDTKVVPSLPHPRTNQLQRSPTSKGHFPPLLQCGGDVQLGSPCARMLVATGIDTAPLQRFTASELQHQLAVLHQPPGGPCEGRCSRLPLYSRPAIAAPPKTRLRPASNPPPERRRRPHGGSQRKVLR